MQKRILKKTSSPWAPYLKKRAGSPPTTRFGKAMFMTWPATSLAFQPTAALNDLPGKALLGRLAHLLGPPIGTATLSRRRKAL